MPDKQQSSWSSKMGDALGISTAEPAASTEQPPVFDGAAGVPGAHASQPPGPGSIMETTGDPNIHYFVPQSGAGNAQAPLNPTSPVGNPASGGEPIPYEPSIMENYSPPDGEIVHNYVPQGSAGNIDAVDSPPLPEMPKDLGVSVKGEAKNLGKKAGPPPTIPKILQPTWGLDLDDLRDIYVNSNKDRSDIQPVLDYVEMVPVVGDITSKVVKTAMKLGSPFPYLWMEMEENFTDSREKKNIKRLEDDAKEKFDELVDKGKEYVDDGIETIQEAGEAVEKVGDEFGDEMSKAASQSIGFLGELI